MLIRKNDQQMTMLFILIHPIMKIESPNPEDYSSVLDYRVALCVHIDRIEEEIDTLQLLQPLGESLPRYSPEPPPDS
jgi:hypothetical protein